MSTFRAANTVMPLGAATAGAVAWRFKGELRITAVVKAAFAFADGGPMPRAEPWPVFLERIHHGDSVTQSVRFSSDLVPYRKRADVLFTGFAHAPGGRAVESMTVRLTVSDASRTSIDKSLRVEKKGGFERIPLTYERAYGGLGHADNPYGEGFEDDDPSNGPNIVDPADPRRVGGFAPIAEVIGVRRRLLGALPQPTFGDWITEIPGALDFDFFQTAPLDQRIDFLRGNEWILLEGLHPTIRSLRMCLPGARCLARIHGLAAFGMQEGRPLAMSADTLHISGDEEVCTVTWRGTFPVASEAALAAARVAAGVESPGQPIEWPDPAAVAAFTAAATPARRSRNAGGTQPLHTTNATLPVRSRPADSGALPFRPAPAGARPDATTALPPQRPARRRADADETLPVASRPAPMSASLPFMQNAASPAGEPARDAKPEDSPAEAQPVAPPPAAEASPPPPAESEPTKPEPAKATAPKSSVSPWAPAPPEPPPAPRPAASRPQPPSTDVKGKLYGNRKKP